MDHDRCISGGAPIGGSGRPGIRTDRGIRGGRTLALGQVPGLARRRIDAA
ncbi:MAG: hypothetical protein U1E97_07465 [Alphaproteobacteria bacterium]